MQTCQEKCCHYFLKPYVGPYSFHRHEYDKINHKIKKAGCFIYHNDKVLLVQSRGQFWGSPKGTMKENETPLKCAIREVKEETGIEIDEKECVDTIIIKGRAQYYFIEMEEKEVHIQEEDTENDANGIGWFRLGCLKGNEKFILNQNCRMLIKQRFGIDL